MKRSKGLLVALSVVVLTGFLSYDMLAPERGEAKAKATVKKAVKKDPAPVVAVSSSVAELAKKVSVDIIGAGYDPDQEVRILLTDGDGMQTDIGYALEPAPKANKAGAWSTTWTCDEFIKAKLISPGAFALTVTDGEFKPIAQTVIAFKEAAKKADKGEKKKKE